MTEDSTTPQSSAKVKKGAFYKGMPGGPGRPKVTPEERLVKRAAKEVIVKFLQTEGLGAASRIVELSKQAKNEKVKLSANTDILDRIGVASKVPGVAVQINFKDNDL